MRRITYAFTLVELLIVIAIIGILAGVGIPSYQHYLKQARFSEVIMATLPFKTAVAMGLQDGLSKTALASGENGIPDSPEITSNLASVKVKSGVITAKASKRAGGYTYILTPNNDGTRWVVSGTCMEAKACKS
jgi:type IV pilus assembly protein PilA